MAKKSGLGKGLDALFIDNNTDEASVSTMKISQIEPNKSQPRTKFDEEPLRELADSIREHGVIQPLIVRPLEQGGYQIVAGERRWRAARMAGLGEVPVIVRELNDDQTLEIAIIENLQREDLNAIELALGYKALIDHHGMTQEQVADKLGKSRPVIANTIRLLLLPPTVIEHVRTGKVSQGHAKALLALENPALMEQCSEKIVHGGLLVRDIEKLARERKIAKDDTIPSEGTQRSAQLAWADNYYREMELAIQTELSRKVKIQKSGTKSTIVIEFYNNEELADIASRLCGTDN